MILQEEEEEEKGSDKMSYETELYMFANSAYYQSEIQKSWNAAHELKTCIIFLFK